jgi:hypothetical protein
MIYKSNIDKKTIKNNNISCRAYLQQNIFLIKL